MKDTDKAMEQMSTLLEQMNNATQKGYTVNFKVMDNYLEAPKDFKRYTPEQVQITNFYRFEGNSDPEDNAILYLVRTDDGLKGLLIDAYGVYADETVAHFIIQVEDIQKKLYK